jgi:hypothetical protein
VNARRNPQFSKIYLSAVNSFSTLDWQRFDCVRLVSNLNLTKKYAKEKKLGTKSEIINDKNLCGNI